MRFNLSSQTLSSRLLSLARVINSKNTLQILDCFLFEVAGGQVTITASDSENVMKATLNLDDCEGDGRFAVNNRTIIDAVKELPDQPLKIEVVPEENKMYVSYQNGAYNFPIQPADEYPQVQLLSDGATALTIDSQTLSSNLNRSLFATAQDELRPVMNGIYFDLTQEHLTIVATNGHKLVRNINYNVKGEQPASFVLPKKPATLLKNTLAKDGGDVIIRFDERQAEISYADGVLYCRLTEGRYPNYASVIPQNNPNLLNIDRKSMISALKRILPFASESSQLVRLHIEAGHVELSAEDIDFATSAKESTSCDYSGNPMNIGFKGSSLSEVLNNLEGDEVQLQLADPSRAGVIVPMEQPEGSNVLMLIMPMLLNE